MRQILKFIDNWQNNGKSIKKAFFMYMQIKREKSISYRDIIVRKEETQVYIDVKKEDADEKEFYIKNAFYTYKRRFSRILASKFK